MFLMITEFFEDCMSNWTHHRSRCCVAQPHRQECSHIHETKHYPTNTNIILLMQTLSCKHKHHLTITQTISYQPRHHAIDWSWSLTGPGHRLVQVIDWFWSLTGQGH